VLDLGIALLQEGRCLPHAYDSTATVSVSEARIWAQSSLKYLDFTLPVDFTQVVYDCIEHEQRSIPASTRGTNGLRMNSCWTRSEDFRGSKVDSTLHQGWRNGASHMPRFMTL
jgi:hypothetical protein